MPTPIVNSDLSGITLAFVNDSHENCGFCKSACNRQRLFTIAQRSVWEIDVLNDVVAYVTASKRVGNVGEVWETRFAGACCSHFTQTQVTIPPCSSDPTCQDRIALDPTYDLNEG
jgi:hypothetical protein